MHHWLKVIALSLAFLPTGSAQEPLQIQKIDPPNWYATLPKPMLLLHGTGLKGAAISLSDKGLRAERVTYSDNGHYAQVWLSASPARPETVQITATRASEHTSTPFTFAAPRPATDGMAGFSPRDLMYLIMTDRFADGDLTNDGPDAHSAAASPEAAAERAKPKGWHGGDLRGIDQHLDYLQSFGMTALWPTPVYQNHGPEAYHGYHCTDYYAVDEHYGSLDDLKKLAKDLHGRGMKLVLDTVPNHVGPFHPWVHDEPMPDWFHGTAAQHVEAQFDFHPLVDPHAPERDRLPVTHGWFVDLLPDMNTENPVVSQYLRQNSIWWIEETGADALRIDTFPYVDRQFWHDFHTELLSLFPHLTEVGEVSNGDVEITSAFADGVTRAGVDTKLYTPFDFPLYHATRNVFANGQPMSRLADVLGQDYLYPHPERLVPFLGNHDESRFASSVTDPALQQVAYAFLLTSRGTPQVYSGDEIAMQGGNDPDNRRDFPGGFPGASSNAFSASGRDAEQQGLFRTLSDLAALRKAHPALSCGAEQILAKGQDILAYARVGMSKCTQTQAQDPVALQERLLVVLRRSAAAPVRLPLQGTSLEGCRPESIWPGSGNLTGSSALQLDGSSLISVYRCGQ